MRLSSATIILAAAASVAAHPLPSNRIRWTDCAKNVPESDITFNSSTVDLSSLPSTLHCGELDVPMDYSKPFCETNKITLGLAMVRPAHPKGGLFFNPGGSDAGVVVAWEVALNLTNAFDGLLDFDLFVMDMRGTYSSNPLNVSLDLFAGLGGPYPTTQTEYDNVKNASAMVIQSWVDNSSPPGIIEHVGTREVVQDYEMARRALGYEKINFLGASQGGFRASQYAATFPHRVGNFVMDASAPHGRVRSPHHVDLWSMYDQVQDSVAGMNRVMLRADAYCRNNASCPFHSEGKGSVVKAVKQIINTAKQTPYLIPSCVNSTTCSPYITDLDIRNGLQGALLGSPDFPSIFEAIYSTLSGDASAFISPPSTVASVNSMPLLCNDCGSQKLACYSRGNANAGTIDYPRTFEYFKKSLDDGLKLACSGWTFPVPENKRIKTNQSLLIIAADFDASAPEEWTIFNWETAPNSVLAIKHGEDHGSFPLVHQPATKMMNEFLNTGVLPSAQNSSQVSVYTHGMKPAPISDPYAVPTGPEAGDVDSGVVVEIGF
ncbi:putative hydrolase [Lachnellula willkommii]|uniref:Putative hydrolase n=1 Tax=Lachnellula willkommii TaxID=215461 RepID=A0A559MI71_9HELO|nr:putative hydrolase [Lachnellula willkommii]